MPSIEKVLREEILRLARKEAKAATADLKKTSAAQRRTIAEFRRRIESLERENKRLNREMSKVPQPAVESVDDSVDSARITAKTIKSIRKQLGLSQADLAKLVGVAAISVSKWEQKEGRLSFRSDAKAKLVAVRAMTKKEAMEKLEQFPKFHVSSFTLDSAIQRASNQDGISETPHPRWCGTLRDKISVGFMPAWNSDTVRHPLCCF